MRQLLDESGLPWRIEEGSRHRKVIVAERVLTILPKSPVHIRRQGAPHMNAMGHIRRGLKELGKLR
jgi:hypothetical protein